MKKILSAVIFICILFTLQGFAQSEAQDLSLLGQAESSAFNYIKENVKSPEPSSVYGEWAVIGIYRSLKDTDSFMAEEYKRKLLEKLKENSGTLSDRKNTEYARAVIALLSIGENPRSFCGYDLVSPLTDFDKTVRQGLNGAVYALIALSAAKSSDTVNVREKYLAKILDSQTAEGGWSVSGTEPDADMTAMALTALSPYKNRQKVKEASSKGFSYLSSIQTDRGGFFCGSKETSESVSQVIVALTAHGIALDSPEFVKNGKSVISALLDYRLSSGGFCHIKGEGENQMASEQALYALCAAERFYGKKTPLFDMNDYADIIEKAVQNAAERSF